MDNYSRSIPFVLEREGGYVSAEQAAKIGDLGGETNMGITKRDFPDEDIKNLTLERVRELYQQLYWNSDGLQQACCDHLPWPLCLVHLDATVNIGNQHRGNDGGWIWTGNANKVLQTGLGAVPDGRVGPATIALAANADISKANIVLDARRQYYRNLAQSVPRLEGNLHGWLSRCDQLEHFISN